MSGFTRPPPGRAGAKRPSANPVKTDIDTPQKPGPPAGHRNPIPRALSSDSPLDWRTSTEVPDSTGISSNSSSGVGEFDPSSHTNSLPSSLSWSTGDFSSPPGKQPSSRSDTSGTALGGDCKKGPPPPPIRVGWKPISPNTAPQRSITSLPNSPNTSPMKLPNGTHGPGDSSFPSSPDIYTGLDKDESYIGTFLASTRINRGVGVGGDPDSTPQRTIPPETPQTPQPITPITSVVTEEVDILKTHGKKPSSILDRYSIVVPLPSVPASGIYKEAWLQKRVRAKTTALSLIKGKSGSSKAARWHRRYFVLTPYELIWYHNDKKNPRDKIACIAIRGAKTFNFARDVYWEERKGSRHYQFGITPFDRVGSGKDEDILSLETETHTERVAWMDLFTKLGAIDGGWIQAKTIHPGSYKEGWLFKQGRKNRKTARRYFVLLEGELVYYKTPTDTRSRKTMALSPGTMVNEAMGEDFGFVIVGETRVLCLAARDGAARDCWMVAIQTVANAKKAKEGWMSPSLSSPLIEGDHKGFQTDSAPTTLKWDDDDGGDEGEESSGVSSNSDTTPARRGSDVDEEPETTPTSSTSTSPHVKSTAGFGQPIPVSILKKPAPAPRGSDESSDDSSLHLKPPKPHEPRTSGTPQRGSRPPSSRQPTEMESDRSKMGPYAISNLLKDTRSQKSLQKKEEAVPTQTVSHTSPPILNPW